MNAVFSWERPSFAKTRVVQSIIVGNDTLSDSTRETRLGFEEGNETISVIFCFQMQPNGSYK